MFRKFLRPKALPDLPAELWAIIVDFAIHSDFNAILRIRITSRWLEELVNAKSIELLNQYWNLLPEQLDQHATLSKSSSTFFRFVNEEAKRLNISLRYLNKRDKRACYIFSLKNEPKIEGDKLGFAFLSERKANLLGLMATAWCKNAFRLTVTKNNPMLPDRLYFIMISAVNSRMYELLEVLFQDFKKNPNICEERMIDEVYSHAIKLYSKVEFIRLLRCIPIDLNRQVGYSILDLDDGYQYSRMPLLHMAAQAGNISVFNYMIDNGANIGLLSDQGKSVIDVLNEARIRDDGNTALGCDDELGRMKKQNQINCQLIYEKLTSMMGECERPILRCS